MFAEYSWKIWIFSVDTSRTLLRNQPNTNHTVFQLDFFLQTTLYLHMIYQPKYIRCPVLAAAKSLFSQPKIDRKYSFWHSAADEFENSFSKTFNTRFRSRRSDHGKRYFQKLGLVEVFCDFFFESILPGPVEAYWTINVQVLKTVFGTARSFECRSVFPHCEILSSKLL